MASTIAAGTTAGTAIAISGDTSGSLVLQTNGTTTAVTISTAQVVTLAQPLPVASGGTGSILGGTDKIQPITASAASSALTITLSPTVLDFRSATIGSGTVTTVSNAAAISVVVPSTATLGTVNAVQSRLVVLAINNAGTMELAVTNISGGSDLSETGVISTTLIAAASNSATLYYSTTARTSVAYRVVGYVESTQATAGTWATAPSTIQGYGGQAVAAMSSLGYGQTWQTVTRTSGTTYYNTTGKPIVLNTLDTHGVGYTASTITVSGLVVSYANINGNMTESRVTVIGIGSSYVLSNAGSLSVSNQELR